MPVNGNLTPQPIKQLAEAYVQMGYSVIPLRRGRKIAAVFWKPYQHQMPTDAELETWFNRLEHAGIAIVTGAVSGLAVLDFDIVATYDAFRETFPHLADTFTVKTQRGYHLYFKLPTDYTLRSRQSVGVDLQVDGKYVVAPPTIINGHTYTPHHITDAHLLTADEQVQIHAFLDTLADNTLDMNDEVSLAHPSEGSLHIDQVLNTYYKLMPRVGRNNALFQVACWIRDHGWSKDRAQQSLTMVHARQQGNTREHVRARVREAEHTIASAYSRPPRKHSPTEPTSWLPNTVRETLLSMKLRAVLRTIEGLYALDVKPGTPISYTSVVALLKGIVGKYSIEKALHSGIIPPYDPPLSATASTSPTMSSIKCLNDTLKKAGKSRPTTWYVLPNVQTLCQILGVHLSGGDTIELRNIASVKGYRQTVYVKHIARCPGQYSRQLLSKRVGVTVQTIRTYDRECGVTVTPMYTHVPLYWHNLKRLVPRQYEHASPGTFLLDHTGKKYPLKYGIACRLLKARRTTYVVTREVNHYSMGPSSFPSVPANYALVQEPNYAAVAAYFDAQKMAVGQTVPAGNIPKTPARRIGIRIVHQDKPGWTPYPKTPPTHMPLSEEQITYWAAHVCERINARVDHQDADKRISKETAQHLVKTYGVKWVRRGLSLIERRSNIETPAGFLIVFLRSENTRSSIKR